MFSIHINVAIVWLMKVCVMIPQKESKIIDKRLKLIFGISV